eukprot:TRINITY_DN20607_c0_g1::TRINITY_DN20607_c0_g1_i1::g.12363::m.12363 TRINITY_DN20607_c0_g1::TRINITY_DN20607_c0_g1_i1::g.12363  ORF type:complete len:160 (+),score=28.13,sp/Q9CZB9/TM128_MOUSE/28.68/2e-11,MFS_1/PF07690.11/0.00019,DUF912/PF06024.7/0.094,DUF912/PF06024.7/2.7e+03,FA_desaturase/PF00487.19/95,FA_desaturase/PF00487.19/3 TRINITY_DN20607_c0_g1_i1:90-569(+)
MSNRNRYSRIPTDEFSSNRFDEDPARIKQREMNRVWIKAEAVMWITVMLVVMYYTNFINIVLYDFHINRMYLFLAMACFGVDVVVFLYLAVYLKYWVKTDKEWDEYSPYSIPIATVSGLLCGVFWILAIWAIWGWWSIPMLALYGMGLMMSANFIPDII